MVAAPRMRAGTSRKSKTNDVNGASTSSRRAVCSQSCVGSGLGHAYALQGRLAEGRALLEEAMRESIRLGARNAYWVVRLSEVCRLAGHREEAWQHARQALDLALQQKNRGSQEHALYQLGTVQAQAVPPEVT